MKSGFALKVFQSPFIIRRIIGKDDYLQQTTGQYLPCRSIDGGVLLFPFDGHNVTRTNDQTNGNRICNVKKYDFKWENFLTYLYAVKS